MAPFRKGGPDEDEAGDFAVAPPRPSPWRARRRQFGLRHIMGLSVVVGLVFAAVARAQKSNQEGDFLLAGIAIAAAVEVFGLILALRFERWSVVGWSVVVLAPTVLAVAATVGENDKFAILVAVLMVPLLIGTIVHVVRRLRAAQQEAMLWTLALAADRGRPLAPSVRALAEQSSGRARGRLRRVAECLEYGLSLPEALDFVRKSAPGSARVLVRLGHDSGALPEALRDAAASRSARPPGWQGFGAKVGYLCLVLAFLQGIVLFFLFSVAPKMEAIYKDFGLVLPRMTRTLLDVSLRMSDGVLLPLSILLELLALLYLPFAVAGFGELKVPILDRLFLRRHSVMILRGLAMVVESGRPLGVGLKTLADSYPALWVRERLAGVYLAAEAGHDWIDALGRFGLITGSDLALLESSRRAGNLPWALRELADSNARRLLYRVQAAGQVLFAALLLAVGAAVGFVCVAYFLPLVQLIERLTG